MTKVGGIKNPKIKEPKACGEKLQPLPTPQSRPPDTVTFNPFSWAFPQSSTFPNNIPVLLFPDSSAVNTDFLFSPGGFLCHLHPRGEFLCHLCPNPHTCPLPQSPHSLAVPTWITALDLYDDATVTNYRAHRGAVRASSLPRRTPLVLGVASWG